MSNYNKIDWNFVIKAVDAIPVDASSMPDRFSPGGQIVVPELRAPDAVPGGLVQQTFIHQAPSVSARTG